MKLTVLTIVRGRSRHLENQKLGWLRSQIKPDRWVIVGMDEDVNLPTDQLPFDVTVDRVDGDGMTLPLATARNRAASLCGSGMMVFLDVDCIASPMMLQHFRNAIIAEDRLWMGSPRYLSKGVTTAGWTFDHLQRNAVPHPLQPQIRQGHRMGSSHYEKFWSLSFGLRRATFNRIGGFSESFAGYGGEDTDFAFAARRSEVPFGFVGAIAYHQHHEVCKPPLNHFRAIIQNAVEFRRRWNVWPMQSWLLEFQRLGYIEFQPDGTEISLRACPTNEEIERSTVSTPAGF